MSKITYKELIIACEACHKVQKFPVETYEECLEIFKNYHCPTGCGPNLYSFFTVGKMERKKKN